jgi:hypothetical protein
VSYSLKLPRRLKSAGWRVKIRDKERLELPHVTILHRARSWRFGLRDMQYLDLEPEPADIPDDLLTEVVAHIDDLRREWDAMYPGNRISGQAEHE